MPAREPPTGAPVAGIPRIGDTFVIRNNPKPLWVPFALADALKPIQKARLKAFEDARNEYAKRQAEFEVWKSPARRASRRADWQKAAAAVGGSKGAEFLAEMEKAEPQIEAQQAADVAPGGPLDKRVRAAERDALIVADGTSCRHQIRDGAGREALHVARVLQAALA